jgi:hypothetical protein
MIAQDRVTETLRSIEAWYGMSIRYAKAFVFPKTPYAQTVVTLVINVMTAMRFSPPVEVGIRTGVKYLYKKYADFRCLCKNTLEYNKTSILLYNHSRDNALGQITLH